MSEGASSGRVFQVLSGIMGVWGLEWEMESRVKVYRFLGL